MCDRVPVSQPVGARNTYTQAKLIRRRKPPSLVMHTLPANETADLVSLNMAAPVRSVSDMRDNPKTLNRSGVYIDN